MSSQFANRPTLPISVYSATAVCCWLIPSQFTGSDGTVILNAYPTQGLALASAALLAIQVTMRPRWRLAFAAAATWALAAISTATMFALLWLASSVARSALEWGQGVLLGAASGALCALARQMAQQPGPDRHPLPRGLVALGLVLLALCVGMLALRVWGVLRPPVALEQMADMSADLTVSLWIVSAVLSCGAVAHVVLRRCVHFDAAWHPLAADGRRRDPEPPRLKRHAC